MILWNLKWSVVISKFEYIAAVSKSFSVIQSDIFDCMAPWTLFSKYAFFSFHKLSFSFLNESLQTDLIFYFLVSPLQKPKTKDSAPNHSTSLSPFLIQSHASLLKQPPPIKLLLHCPPLIDCTALEGIPVVVVVVGRGCSYVLMSQPTCPIPAFYLRGSASQCALLPCRLLQ